MRFVLPILVAAIELPFIAFLSGCGDTNMPVSSQGFNLRGTLLIEGGADPSRAVVAAYSVQPDAQLFQALVENPTLGISDYVLMAFDPWAQEAVTATVPSLSGDFEFENLGAGHYIINASLPGYACPNPVEAFLQSDSDVGTLSLAILSEVNGILPANTTWESGTAHLITGDIIVPPDITLTIESGALALAGGDYSITASGGLAVGASPSQPVRLWLTEEFAASGGDWGGVRLDGPSGDCSISGMVIRGATTALSITGGEVSVAECLFDFFKIAGVSFQGDANGATGNCIVKDGATGLVADQSDPEFHGNLILRMTGSGIELKSASQADVHNNAIIDCQNGIWSSGYCAPTVEYNLISGGNLALYAESGFEANVRFNEFRHQSEKGIYLFNGCYPMISDNNFFDMPQVILHVNGNSGLQADTVFALLNYWDGEDSGGIPGRIIDGHDIGSQSNPVGPVDYEPFRLQMITGAGP